MESYQSVPCRETLTFINMYFIKLLYTHCPKNQTKLTIASTLPISTTLSLPPDATGMCRYPLPFALLLLAWNTVELMNVELRS